MKQMTQQKTFLKIVNNFNETSNMIKLKILIFSTVFLINIFQIILKYMETKQKPKLYDFALPFIFLWLLIKNLQKL